MEQKRKLERINPEGHARGKAAKSTIPQYPTEKKKEPIIQGNRFAGLYRSSFTEQSQTSTLELLGHVNCSYLSSSNNAAVNLLELKQHAQSLTNLIRHLGLSTSPGAVNKAESSKLGGDFLEGEVFDWLNDLDMPYTNQDESHNKSLTTLLNQLSNGLKPITGNEQDLMQEKCPLESVKKVSDAQRQYMHPLATNEALAKHANEILERLDHEFSSVGGVLGMLPVDDESYAVKLTAQNTFLGQWIAFTRAIVMRCHELEQGYAAALDVLAGEAVVPREMMGQINALDRKSRLVDYDQDHFVICNAEKKIWPMLSAELSGKESSSNDAINWISVPTRYYRLRDSTTIFVVPSLGNNETWDITSRPAVVQVVKPKWGDHTSTWEEKFKDEMLRARTKETELSVLRNDYRRSLDDIVVLTSQKQRWNAEKAILKAAGSSFEQEKWMGNARAESARLVAEAKQLDNLGQELMKRKEAVEKREIEAETWFKQMAETWRAVTGQVPPEPL